MRFKSKIKCKSQRELWRQHERASVVSSVLSSLGFALQCFRVQSKADDLFLGRLKMSNYGL